LREYEEIEISRQAVEVTVNSKKENFLRLLSAFLPRIWPPIWENPSYLLRAEVFPARKSLISDIPGFPRLDI
jgi:hypothetical protein